MEGIWKGHAKISPFSLLTCILISALLEKFPKSPLKDKIKLPSSKEDWQKSELNEDLQKFGKVFDEAANESGHAAKIHQMVDVLVLLAGALEEGKESGELQEADARKLVIDRLDSPEFCNCMPAFFAVMFKILFKLIDFNNDGKIDADELQKVTGCDATWAKIFFKSIDANHDGIIDEQELTEAASAQGCSDCSLM